MTKHQVIVVGAGPSGSGTAFYLAEQGVDVLLVDKETWPRDKVCGDGQMSHCWPIYREMGIAEEARAAGTMSKGILISDTREKVIRIDTGKDYTIGTRRYVIDDIVRRAAVREGAQFLENFEVLDLILHRGKVIGVRALFNGVETEAFADLVVLANGSHSMQARSLGIYNEDPETLWMGARGYFENVRGMTDLIELHYPFADMFPAGYMWVFPEGDGIANVGVFITSGALRRSGMRLEDYFDRWRDETAIGQERLEAASLLGDIKGWRLPSCWELGKIHAKGCLLVGDTASSIETWGGEGFFTALSGGRAAGKYLGARIMEGTEITDEVLEEFEQFYRPQINPLYQMMGTVRKQLFQTPEQLNGFSDFLLKQPPERLRDFKTLAREYMMEKKG